MTSLKRGGGASVLAVASALVLLLSSCGGGSSGGGEAFNGFGGQDVEILVPTGAGGGTDTTARFIAERIPSHLNDPSIHIANVDGASHIVGMNEFEKKRDHDGLHWLVSSGTGHLPYLFGEPAVQFDLGELNPILASPVGNVVIVNKDAGVTNVKDLKGKTLVYGGSGPVGSDTTQLLGLDLLGVNLQPLFGFDEGPQRIAFEQGEIDVIYNTTPAYLSGGKDLVDRGVGVPLYTAGQLVNGEVVRDPAFPDLPSIAEAYETINGKPPSGPQWDAYKALLGVTTSFSKVMWLHGDAPEESVKQVTEAAEAMANEPGFKEASGDILGGYDLTVGPEAAAQIRDAFDVDQSAMDWLAGWLKDKFDVVPGQ
jgi:hypothetical protein